MKKINSHKVKYVAAGLCLLSVMGVTTSCSDFFDVESRHVLPDNEHWQTLEDARGAMMGVYGLMRAAMADNNTFFTCGELRAGDFTAYNRPDLDAVIHNQLNLNIPLVNEVADWSRFYRVINAAAILIDNVDKAQVADPSYSEQTAKWDKAQARALRALAYFELARIWGDVPLITEAYDNGSFPKVKRTPVAQVLQYAKNELIAAAKDLPFLFGTDTNLYYRQKSDVWRGMLFSKLSAYAVLAQLSAWMGNYADADSYAQYVTDNVSQVGVKEDILAVSSITSSNNGLFNGSSTTYGPQRIAALVTEYSDGNMEYTPTGHLEQWTLSEPYVNRPMADLYVSRDSLLNIYPDVKDLRMGVDTATMKYADGYFNMNRAVPVFSKVNVMQDGSPKDEDFAVFSSAIILSRPEDMYLLRAEALTMLNRTTDAIGILNKVRVARGLDQVSYQRNFGNNPDKLLDAVFAERRRELIGEGQRWYDLIRRQKIRKDNPALLRLIEEGGIYWPVSEEVIRQNPSIEQNPYWKNH